MLRAQSSVAVAETLSCSGIPITPAVVTAAVTAEALMQPGAVLTFSVGVLNITCQNGLLGDRQVGEKELTPWGL